jgi:hypothetical protein
MAVQVKSSISHFSAADASRITPGSEHPASRDSSEDATADLAQGRVVGALAHHLEHRDGERFGDQLERDRLDVPAGVRQDAVEEHPLVVRHRVVQPSQPVRDVALEDLVVPRLVQDLGRLEELLVGAGDHVDELAARQEGALLAVDQDGQPPGRDAPVQLDALLLRKQPRWGCVDVHGSSARVRRRPALGVQAMSREAFHWSRLAFS